MRKGESAPIVPVDMRLADVLVKITEARAGAAAVVDRDGLLVGLFTDGDLRRTLQRGRHLLDEPVSKSMTRSPRTIGADHLAAEGLKEMEARKIGEIPVVDEAGHPLGMLNLKDCLRAGLV
jgi:arabinose-5-phosphate isomerase